MKILVCIKQVPDMESAFKPNGAGDWYDETDLAYRMNEYDGYAVEQAVQVKEKGEGEVVALCIGPERAKETIKKALAMGADRAVHIKDDEYYKKDPYQIASLIAAFAKAESFDLIFTGNQSSDRGSAQVGVYIGEMLGIPSVSTVVGFELDGDAVTAVRELDGGLKAKVKTKLPALFTCQLGLNSPRYPTLPNIMKAKKKEIKEAAPGDYLKEEAVAETAGMFVPEKKGAGQVLEGDVNELADKLISILREKGVVG